jgi:hypothetical protein
MTLPWLQTHTGRVFPLIDPMQEDVRWPDVIYALAHINRFTGHAGTYSVAQHSCLVAEQLPHDMKLYGLLHDAHEAYIGDVSTPLKKTLKMMYGLNLWSLVDSVDEAIHLAADLPHPVPQTIREAVKIADVRALVTERRDLMRAPPQRWGDEYEDVIPLPEKIVRWTPHQAIARFALALGAAGLQVSTCTFVGN